MKKLLTLLAAVIFTHISVFAIIDEPVPTAKYMETSLAFRLPVQKYKHVPYSIRTDDRFIPNHTDIYDFKPLGTAIWKGDHKELQRLLDSGVSPNQPQQTMSPLGIAVQGDNIEAFKILMNHKDIDVNQFYTVIVRGDAVQSTTLTAIADAVNLGNPEMMRMLLDKGANVDYVYEDINISANPNLMTSRQTPLTRGFATIGHYTYKAKYPTSRFNVLEQFKQLQRIADKTTNLNRLLITHTSIVGPGNIPIDKSIPCASEHMSLLMTVISVNNYADAGSPFRGEINKIIFSLIERGANPNYGYPYDIDNFIKLTQYGSAKFGGASVKASIEAMKDNGKYMRSSVIMSAVLARNPPMVQYLFEKDVDIEVAGDKGSTLFTSISSPGVLRVFLDNGFSINTVDHNGYGLLFSALKTETGLLEEMLRQGVNPNLTIKGMGNALTFSRGMTERKREAATINLLKSYGAVEYVAETVNPVKTSPPSAKDIKAMKYAILNPNEPNVKVLGVSATPNYRRHNKYVAKMDTEVMPLYKQLTAKPTAAQWNKIITAMNKVINEVNGDR